MCQHQQASCDAVEQDLSKLGGRTKRPPEASSSPSYSMVFQ